MLLAQKIANLLGGVSQRPPALRSANQSEIQENIWDHHTLGKRRRPPTQQIARLSASTSGFTSAFLHEVRQSTTDRYVVAVVNGDLQVYDLATGASEAVVFPKGKSYLTSVKGFKAYTVGDTTYLVNMDTVIRRGTKKAPQAQYEALVFVRQADYATTYAVTLNGITVSITTPEAAGPTARFGIATDTLALELEAEIVANAKLNADFSVVALGSTLHVSRLDGKDFDISSTDGLADKGLKIVKGSVQTFADLPARALDGMIVEVAGDPESTADNYWVRYTDSKQPGQMGSWVECAAPGTPVNLDVTTMPWALKRGGKVKEDLQADPAPQQPSIVALPSTAFTGGFTSDPDSGQTFTGDQDIVLQNDDQRVDGDIGSSDGSERTIQVFYDVDTTLLDYGQNVMVQLYLDTGSGFVLRDSAVYESGRTWRDESLHYTINVPSGSTARVQIHYGGDSTPESRSRLALVTLHKGSSDTGGGIITTYTSQMAIGFPATGVYPVGTVLTLTINGTPFVQTITGSDKTGAQVATAFAGIITGYTVTNPTPGNIQLANTSSAPITWSASCTITLPALVLYDAAVTMTPAEHVGRIIFNRTDGSQGTVTANGVHSVTVGSLSGGITNTFSPGDICDIEIPTNSFMFSTAEWAERGAGDLDICPLPSFVDQPLNEVFFYRNRLGFTAGNSVVLSESGNPLNFMRVTATELLDSDVIDIRSAHPSASTFEHAVEWDGDLVVCSAAGHQFRLTGDPILSPKTAELPHMSSFPISTGARPVTVGKYLFAGAQRGITGAFSSVLQFYRQANDKADAITLTEDVPQYIAGVSRRYAGDADIGFLAVLSSGATDTLWVYSYAYQESESPYSAPQKILSSWSKWTFSGAQIISISMLDGVLSLVTVRSDGVYLEKIDLGNPPVASADHRDRQGSGSPVASTMRWQLSPIFYRGAQTGTPETRGRLQLRNAYLSYHDATDFTVTVTPQGRAPVTYTFHSASPSAGDFLFQILTRNTYATIEITNSTNGGCAFSGLDWEGDYTTRARRV